MQASQQELLCRCLILIWINYCEPRSNRPDCFAFAIKTETASLRPHDYGVHKGVVKLLTRQVRGSSSRPLPGWRWMEIDQISNAEMLGETFPGGRPTPSGKHHTWDELFIRVKPAKPKPD